MKNRIGKRGELWGPRRVFEYWVEYLLVFFVFVGFFLALSLRSAGFIYLASLLAGLFSGKIYFDKRKSQPILAPLLLIIGFIVGFTLGTVQASRLLAFVLFVSAAFFSNYAHKKKWITYSKHRPFIR